MESEKKFRLEDLAELTGIPRRTIRFYIQKGYVAPPLGQKRGSYYTNEHLEELLKIKRLSNKNVPLKEITSYDEDSIALPEPEIGTISWCSHIFLGTGMTLVLDNRKAGIKAEALPELTEKIIELVQEYKQSKGENNE